MKNLTPDYTLLVDGNDTKFYKVTDTFLKSLAIPKERADLGMIFNSEICLLKDKKIVSIDENGALYPEIDVKENNLEMCICYGPRDRKIIAPLKEGWLIGMISESTFKTEDDLKKYADDLKEYFSRVHLKNGGISESELELERLIIKHNKMEKELKDIEYKIESLSKEKSDYRILKRW